VSARAGVIQALIGIEQVTLKSFHYFKVIRPEILDTTTSEFTFRHSNAGLTVGNYRTGSPHQSSQGTVQCRNARSLQSYEDFLSRVR
jgi:hypothetical protein